jgi:D-alanyl-D-alanine carboxypeptidase (penicillin-binding protein 5/6)
MRLSARVVIAGLTMVAGGSVAGCSAAPGLAYAGGAARPSPTVTTASLPAGGQATATTAPAGPTPTGPHIDVVGAPSGVKAKAAIVADAATGQVLWGKAGYAVRPIASLAKVMTALVVIRAGSLDREIKIPKSVLNYVAKYGANGAGLIPGQMVTAGELLRALLLVSGADAAYTLAVSHGPGMGAFVATMNATARELGLTHTHFATPDGLPYPTAYATYSTSAEMLKLGEVAMRSPAFRSIVNERFFSMKKGQGHSSYWWGNSNELIGWYRGAVGIKTGYTVVAGHCLLFAAVRGGRALIGVVLGSPSTGPAAGAQDAARILNWGFSLKKSG